MSTRKGGGELTGPNPTVRGKLGTKYHVLVTADGLPLAVVNTGANRHDSMLVGPILDGLSPVTGRGRGRPRRRTIRASVSDGEAGHETDPRRGGDGCDSMRLIGSHVSTELVPRAAVTLPGLETACDVAPSMSGDLTSHAWDQLAHIVTLIDHRQMPVIYPGDRA